MSNALTVRTWLAAAGVVALCAGCSLDPSPPPLPGALPPPRYPDLPRPPHDRTRLRAELEAALTLWHAERPAAYELTVSLYCFCGSPILMVSRISGNTVVGITGLSWHDGRILHPPVRTVELLFSEARRVIEKDADDVTVEFDRQFHFPSRIRIDERRNTFDDETTWVAQLLVNP